MQTDTTGLSVANYVTGDMLVFGGVCIVVAVLVIFLDWVLLETKGYSILDLDPGSDRRLLVLGGWAVASGIVGLGSVSVAIIQPNIQAAIAVAVAWPLILTKIVETVTAAFQTTTHEEVAEE